MTENPTLRTARTFSLGEAYWLAAVSWPVLIIYAAAQGSLSLAVSPHQPDLKLVIEPFVLMLGLILHVQWRRVDQTFREHGLPRPWWIATADCLSFVITFWALGTLFEAILREAKVI